MKNVLEAIACAKEYLLNDRTHAGRSPVPEGEPSLHGALQYRLHDAAMRLLTEFREVTKKDVVMLVEAWIMAQGTRSPTKPLRFPGELEE